MKVPKRIEPLVEDGLVDAVIRQLTSGKEAMVYMVRCGDEIRCAKVYKEANQRSFRQSVDYTEGRKVKNSRRARAMEKGTNYGRKAQEEAWQSAEVDALYRLAAAGVRVLYGGSVNAKNVGEIVGQADVDGALVGGASLDGEQFAILSAIAAGGPLP